MNFSHLNFSNNFVSMHQFSSATKVAGNIQQNIAFIPATSAQHYQNHSNHINFPNNVQVTSTAVIQHHHYQDTSSRVLNQNVSPQSANSISTATTSAQTQWNHQDHLINRLPSDSVKVNTSNFPVQPQNNHMTQTVQRTSRMVVMQSVSTMTDFESPGVLESKLTSKEPTTSEDSDDSAKSSTNDNQQFLRSTCSNSCSKIHLKSNASAMAEYLCRLQPSSIPSNILEFLKRYNIAVNTDKALPLPVKKDCEDIVKVRPEIRLSTALDGSLLYCCSECQMVYQHKELLERHLSVHKAERKFECNVCGVCLKRKEHLDQHKRGHSEERPFVCDICCKGFKRNEHLRRHIVIHSGDKNHVCTQCGKAFSRKDHLNKHLQTHSSKRATVDLSEPTSPLLQLQPQNSHKHTSMYPSKQMTNLQ
ncbi:hypothetical protein J6590_009213 [Homalodisca vitripennis]|nr:hypothetical protein J6590_009213 [Homalodisca vitripennis]